MDRVEIRFENPHNIFYSGQLVNGEVVVAIAHATPVRAITLRVSGITQVRWEEFEHRHQRHQNQHRQVGHHHGPQRNHHHHHGQQHNHNRTEIKVFSSHELYFEYKIALLPPSANDPVLQIGHYRYPFSFNLPHNIPSSFEGTHGSIRYSANCTLDKPFAMSLESKLLFTVICPLDLNRFPHLKIQADASEMRTFWCFFCRSRPITIILRLPESGVVPGQFMTPTIDVDNGSDVRINQVKLTLVMSMIYTAMGKRKVEKKTVIQNYLGAVEPKQVRTWFRGIYQQIPALPPSGLNNCTLIDTSYKLKITAEPERPHLNISVSLPMTVGTIPFQANFDQFRASVVVPPTGWNNPTPTAPVAPTEDESISNYYCSLPPPSYEESIGAQRVSGDYLDMIATTDGDRVFVPKYPVYAALPLPPEVIQDGGHC